MLKFFSGSSGAVNSARAIAECLEIAFEGDTGLDCDLIVIYSSIGHNYREILAEAKRLAPSARLAGCTGAGVIGLEGPNESMKALAVMAVKGAAGGFAVAGAEQIRSESAFDVAARLGKEMHGAASEINTVLFLPSGFDTAQDLALAGLESVLGSDVSVIGASAGDNMRSLTNYQFLDDRVFEKGAVAVGFADPGLEVVSTATVGVDVVGEPLEITRSEGNRVYEINGQPAWIFLTERAGFPPSTPLPEAALAVLLARKLPDDLAAEYASAHYVIVPFVKYDDDSLLFPVVCEEGSNVWNVARNEERMFDELDAAIGKLVEDIGERTPVAFFHADCSFRGRFSLNRILKDEIIGRIQSPLTQRGPVPWLGLYGFGEFAPLAGRNRFHMITTTVSALVRD